MTLESSRRPPPIPEEALLPPSSKLPACGPRPPAEDKPDEDGVGSSPGVREGMGLLLGAAGRLAAATNSPLTRAALQDVRELQCRYLTLTSLSQLLPSFVGNITLSCRRRMPSCRSFCRPWALDLRCQTKNWHPNFMPWLDRKSRLISSHPLPSLWSWNSHWGASKYVS